MPNRRSHDADGGVGLLNPLKIDAESTESHRLRTVGQIAGGVAHDFNNLLTPILSVLEILKIRVRADSDVIALVDGAMHAALTARALIRRLLMFGHEDGAVSRSVSACAAFEGVRTLLQHNVPPSIELKITPLGDDMTVMADPHQLELSLLNLAINARDAMPDGGTLTFSANVVTIHEDMNLSAGHYVDLTVSDTGCGMDDITRASAVTPLFTTKSDGHGTGLGLALVDAFARKAGGALIIDSVLARGTCVTMRLPQVLAALPALRILLVDDEALVRVAIADMLENLDANVVEASSAQEAMSILQNGADIDLVITDLMMPGGNGNDMAADIRRHYPDLPVLILTGYGVSDDADMWPPRLAKPFQSSELADAIRAILTQR